MKVVEDIARMTRLSEECRRTGERIGFVPTMGYLHEGHLSLVRIARARAGSVVASIFVNPTQFGPGEDFERYPSDLDRDMKLLEAEGCGIVFVPSRGQVYAARHRTKVSVDDLSSKLCGRSRPGHFDGVCTVVLKLFNVVRPHFAVFGEKDAQQLVIIRQMTADLNLGIEIVAGPIIREPDGLAASSRNAYLSPEEREQATCLNRALGRGEELVRSGETRVVHLLEEMRGVIESEPLAEIDYVSIVDPVSLDEVETVSGEVLAALAVQFGKTRLIDNIRLNGGGQGE